MLNKNFLVLSIILLIFIGIGTVSANDNATDDISLNEQSSQIAEAPLADEIEGSVNGSSQVSYQQTSKLETDDVSAYYKENFQLTGYLKDGNSQPIANKKVSIFINEKNYDRITDSLGKVVLNLKLKPGTYAASFKFSGDDNFTACSADSIVKVKKASLEIQTGDFKTYFESGFYFKAKVINKITKKPVEGVKVAFKVYSNNKHRIYYATTDSKGIAKLKNNFKVGSYKVVTSAKENKNLKSKKSKAVLTIMETAETGCASLYVQVSDTEAVAGFRRDATNAKTLHIVKYKLNGKNAVKQYKTNSYFFHSLTSCDGWMAGTGGFDNPTINHAIERLAGKMIKSGKIKKSYLDKIQQYEKILGLGHFSIKAPNGQYALVWASGIYKGKLKPGEYLCAPNGKSYFRHGTWGEFSKNPAKAAIKIAATDGYGVNRRDATAFHWKATTSEGKTTSKLKVYGANDDGHLMGRSTGHLKDDIKFMGKFYSKDVLPKTPSSKLLGVHDFGNIDKLIKRQTIVKAPKLTKFPNKSKTFDITVMDSKTKKPIKNLKIKLKVDSEVFKIKTNKRGMAKFNPESLTVGSHKVVGYTDDIRYSVTLKSKILIKE